MSNNRTIFRTGGHGRNLSGVNPDVLRDLENSDLDADLRGTLTALFYASQGGNAARIERMTGGKVEPLPNGFSLVLPPSRAVRKERRVVVELDEGTDLYEVTVYARPRNVLHKNWTMWSEAKITHQTLGLYNEDLSGCIESDLELRLSL